MYTSIIFIGSFTNIFTMQVYSAIDTYSATNGAIISNMNGKGSNSTCGKTRSSIRSNSFYQKNNISSNTSVNVHFSHLYGFSPYKHPTKHLLSIIDMLSPLLVYYYMININKTLFRQDSVKDFHTKAQYPAILLPKIGFKMNIFF